MEEGNLFIDLGGLAIYDINDINYDEKTKES